MFGDWRLLGRGIRSAAALLTVTAVFISHGAVVGRASVTSAGSFTATVSLPEYPCPASCTATLSGHYVGGAAGLEIGGAVYGAVFPDPTGGVAGVLSANLSSLNVSYSDTCPLMPSVVAVAQDASGAVTVSGGALVDSAGRTIEHGIKLVGSWFWSRTLVAGDLEITFDTVEDSGGATIARAAVLGLGVAAFTPLIGTCTAPSSGTVVATMAGAVVNPA